MVEPSGLGKMGMDDSSNEISATERVIRAIEIAQQKYGEDVWEFTEPRAKAAAIYHYLCRLDSGCKRSGLPSDELLPPCCATESFRTRRGCRF